MTDADRAFLAAIRAAPDDDAPRLVYADWLEENGEGAKATFIRFQVNRPACAEPNVLENALMSAAWDGDALLHSLRLSGTNARPSWWATDYGWPSRHYTHPSIRFRRGFVDELDGWTAADWLAHADAILERHPVRKVRLTTWPGLEYEPGHYDRVRLVGDAKWLSVARLVMELDVTKPPENLDAFAYCNRDEYLALRVRWPGVAFELPPEPRITPTRPGDMVIRLVSAVR